VNARALLARGLARAHELAGQPALQAQMLDVVGRLETRLGEYDRARPVLQEALALRRKVYGDNHPDVASSLESLAWVEYDEGNFAEATRLRRDVLALRRRLIGDSDTKTTTSLLELAAAMHAQGDYRGAQPLLDEWISIVSRQRPETTDLRARQLSDLASNYEVRGNSEMAERLIREAAGINRALYGERNPNYANTLVTMGSMISNLGRQSEADSILRSSINILREVYPTGHPDLADALKTLGVVLEHEQRYGDAVAPLREAVAMATRFRGKSARVSDGEINLSIALSRTERYDEAATIARDAKRVLLTRYPANNPLVGRADIALGDALRGLGQHADAESLLLSAFKTFESGRGFSKRPRENALAALVRLYDAEGNRAEAAKYQALRRPLP
jgi:tetratricopeptide (TPR) repeat protein